MEAETSIVPGLLFLAQIVCKEALKLEDWGRVLVLRWRGAHDRSVSLSGCHRRHGAGNAWSIAWNSLRVVVRSLFAPNEAVHKILQIDPLEALVRIEAQMPTVMHHFRGKVDEEEAAFQFTDALMLMRGGRHY